MDAQTVTYMVSTFFFLGVLVGWIVAGIGLYVLGQEVVPRDRPPAPEPAPSVPGAKE